ncbi:MAG TPA: DNA primase [Chloroflexota bacterium]|nr:DNA primase [Chloroflexota bacterium]
MDPVEEIKERLSIEDVVGRYVDLKRSGASSKGLCPFHQEKTPSFYVTPGRGTFHCFGCGKGGDVFTFVQEIERVTFPDALKRLADQAGVTLPERDERKPSHRKRMYEANEVAARWFQEMLGAAGGSSARAYLRNRGFDGNAVQLFGLGYAPAGRDGLIRRMRGAGFDNRFLVDAGLAIQDDSGGAPRDRFRARLMFPIRDSSGRISGFGGRLLDDGQPKYLNSPQTEIFDKSSVLYGIDQAHEAIRRERQAVLVEGYLDALRAHIAGYRTVVASLGTSVTTEQLATLARFAPSVILALDPDPAGQGAAARTALTALAEITRTRGRGSSTGPLELRVARLPAGLGDPDELIRDHPQRWQEAMAGSIPAFDFYFTATLESLDRGVESWRQEAIDRLLPVIQQFSTSAGWQAAWIERLSHATGVQPGALQRALPAERTARPARPARRSDESRRVAADTTARALTADAERDMERALLALLLKVVILPARAAEDVTAATFSQTEHRELFAALMAWQHTDNYDYLMFRESLPDPLQELADGLRERTEPLPDAGKVRIAVTIHLTRLRQIRLQAQLERSQAALQGVDDDDRTRMLQEVARLHIAKGGVSEELERLSGLLPRSTGAADYGTIDHDSGSW